MSVQQGTIRELAQEKELTHLSQYAAKSKYTKGRKTPMEPCPIRTEFQRDRDRILHCKAFRRLKHKTQVFFSPTDDHYRTRMTHTLEVSQVARTISRALNLNEDLTEAIALGHDLGHTPFGHSGEDALNEIMTQGYKHNEQSVRVVTFIEDLNLTEETIDGILHHSASVEGQAFTLEGQIVKHSDKIAYINHDIQDALRAGIIKQEDLPADCMQYFSHNQSERLSKMIYDIIEHSYDKPVITMSEEGAHYMKKLRSWMFENVYTNSIAKSEELKAKNLISHLFVYYSNVLKECFHNYDELQIQRTVSDYISGMTDRYVLVKFEEIFMPSPQLQMNQDNFLLKLAKMNGINS